MKYRPLGSTGLVVSEIGFGSWAISGAGYGSTNDKESKKTLHTALDLGVNFIDTADSYGKGHSEKLIGEVLNERKDKDTIVCTKFGWDFYADKGIKSNLKKEYILFAVEQSLKRLNRDTLDIYLIHSQDPKNILNQEVFSTLESLVDQGKIKFYGMSVSSYHAINSIPLIKGTNCNIIELKFNLLEKETKNIFSEINNIHNIGIIVREPLSNGLLTGKYNKSSKFPKNDHRNGWNKEYLKKQIEKVQEIKKYFKSNSELIKASLKYVLQQQGVSVIIPGAKNIKQVKENISSIDYNLDSITFSYLQ